MKIYIIRHGRTNWNEKGIIQGLSRNRLSSFGLRQVTQTADRYKDTQFDVIIASPLVRTKQTANIMNIYHHTKVVYDGRLVDRDQGVFAGRYKSSLTDEERRLLSVFDKNSHIESNQEVCDRVKDFYAEMLEKYNGFSSILIVTHDMIAEILQCLITQPQSDPCIRNINFRFDNAQIKEFDV